MITLAAFAAGLVAGGLVRRWRAARAAGRAAAALGRLGHLALPAPPAPVVCRNGHSIPAGTWCYQCDLEQAVSNRRRAEILIARLERETPLKLVAGEGRRPPPLLRR